VRSPRGSICLKLLVTQNIRRGTLFVPMHWGSLWADDAACNTLTHPERCPISLEPELKACAVQVIPLSRAHPEMTEASKLKSALPRNTKSTILSGIRHRR
ncbi:nitrate reductase catalytic subunit, partial [filamentous cyanobacterium CCP5]